MNTSKCILKHIGVVEILSEIQRVFSEVTFISAALRITLIEATIVIIRTFAIKFRAIIELEIFRLSARVQAVNV